MVCTDCGAANPEDVGLCLLCVARRLGPPDPLWSRFWSKVEKGPGCWAWTAGVLPSGRGLVQIGGRVHQAHRVAWRLVYGEVPPVVLPDCENVLCVRPSHLLGLTKREAAGWLMAHGTPVGRSTLTAKQVRTARRLHVEDRVTVVVLAERYGVHPNTMKRALRGVTWRHLGEP